MGKFWREKGQNYRRRAKVGRNRRVSGESGEEGGRILGERRKE